MADDGDDEVEDYTKTRRKWPRSRKETKEPAEWNETCIGLWTRDMDGKDWNKKQICNGICIVKINKNMDPSKVKASNTRGLQIIITESGGPFGNQNWPENEEERKKFENIGTDGKFDGPYPPPSQKPKKSHREQDEDQTSLTQDVLSIVGETKDNVAKRLTKYHNDPAAVKELWTEMIDGSKQQYETTKRLLSYVEPKEKIIELKDIAVDFWKDFWSWMDNKKGR